METTLPPNQEKFVTMLIAGKRYKDIASELEVNRATLTAWRNLETVEARYNQLVSEIKTDLESGLMDLYSEAVNTLKDCMAEGSDQTRVKIALWLIDRVEQLEPGVTDPAEIVRQKHTTTTGPFEDLEAFKETSELDQAGYTRRMKELGLKVSKTA
ncbi:MAG: hypothetical protein HOE30_04245 [Deltaproteobacteria bacterium]|jgi:hypothetical protein|nr:hypothetical protein [Deltaproteobacteria bacterium]MBT6614171.1 hypothetical protein [Deltaproteobacteria bacterium]